MARSLDQIKEIIRSLLVKSNIYSNENVQAITEGLQQEAAAAAVKAAELLQKYNLSAADVMPKNGKMHEEVAMYTSARLDKWRINLAYAIASHMFCKSFYRRGYHRNPYWEKRGKVKKQLRWEFVFFGRKDNAEIAAYLWDQLHEKLMEMVEQVVSDYLDNLKGIGVDGFHTEDLGMLHPNVYRNSWLYGAVVGIYRKLEDQRKAVGSDVRAIILLRDEEVQEAWKDKNKYLSNVDNKTSSKVRSDAYQSGVEAGYALDINPGLER